MERFKNSMAVEVKKFTEILIVEIPPQGQDVLNVTLPAEIR